MRLRISFRPNQGEAYLTIKPGKVYCSKELVKDFVIADYRKDGSIIGVEVIGVDTLEVDK